jgi:hypothetical protein
MAKRRKLSYDDFDDDLDTPIDLEESEISGMCGAKLGALTLIEFRDEQARNELLDDPEVKPYLSRFDAGNHPLALVRADALEPLKALLAERGVDAREWSGG